MPFLFAKQKILTRSHWGNKPLAGVHFSNKHSTTHPPKSNFRLIQITKEDSYLKSATPKISLAGIDLYPVIQERFVGV
jgi:hypothetical protein